MRVLVDGGSTGLGRALERDLAGERTARPVDGRLVLDLTRPVAQVVASMAASDAVVEGAVDVDDDGDTALVDGPAIRALRRAVGWRD